MAAKIKRQSYLVYADVTISTAIQIDADSLEDAASKAKELKTEDFVEIIGDHNDSEVKITGVMIN